MAISHVHLRLLLPLASLFFLPALCDFNIDFHHCPNDVGHDFIDVARVELTNDDTSTIKIFGHASDESRLGDGGIVKVGTYNDGSIQDLRTYGLCGLKGCSIVPSTDFTLTIPHFPFVRYAAMDYSVTWYGANGNQGCIYFHMPGYGVYAAA